MSIDDFKRWHWVVVGAILGLVVGYLQTVVGFDPLRAEPRALEQRIFEDELRQQDQGRPKLKDVRVYPDGAHFLVKLQRLAPTGDGLTFAYGEWQLTPPVPYRPREAPHDRGPNYTVLNFLTDTAKKNPSVHFRYAWWATNPMTVLLWTLGGVVAVGGVWPTLVNVLVGAGFGRVKVTESDYDLSRFRSEKDLVPGAKLGEDDAMKLRALEEELARNLQGDGAAPTAVAPAPPPVVALDGGPLRPAAASAAEDDKEFAGQFYPVAHGVQKKPRDGE